MQGLKLHNRIVDIVCLEIYNKNAPVFSYIILQNLFNPRVNYSWQLRKQEPKNSHAKVENPKEKKKKKKNFSEFSFHILHR